MKNTIIRESLMLVVVFLIGIFLRLYKFNTIPFGLNHDGARESLEAIEFSQHPLPYIPLSIKNPWLGETFFRYLLALLISIFDPSVYLVKLYSSLFSIATLFSFYIFANKILGKKVAVFSLVFLSLSGWHIIMGKSVWRAISLPFFETICLYFFVRLLKEKKLWLGVLIGISLTLTLNTYNASRVIPVFLVAATLLFIKGKSSRDIKSILKGSVVAFLVAVVFMIPYFIFVFKYPEIANSRLNYLFIGNKIKEEQSLLPLFQNIRKTALMFNYRAGGDDFFVNEPLLDLPASILFIIGLLFSIGNLKKYPYQFILLGFVVSLLPGIITSPNGNRNIGVLPFVFVLVGVGLDKIYFYLKKLTRWGYMRKTFIMIIIFWMVVVTYSTYFGPKRREIFGFYPEATVLGNYMRSNMDTTEFYIIDNFPRDILTFITYKGGDPFVKHYLWFDNSDAFFDVKIPGEKNFSFVMRPLSVNRSILEKLKLSYPKGEESGLHYYREGKEITTAWMFTVKINDVFN